MADRATPAEVRRVIAAVEKCGVLLQGDAKLASVSTLVAGTGIPGSWWAHERAHAIYDVCERLNHDADIALPRLIAGKVTYVHRRLWPALYVVASSGDEWQGAALRPAVARILKMVKKRGELSMRDVPWIGGERRDSPMECARDLERRLLVYGEGHHTETGAHAKVLESWDHWARRVRLHPRALALPAAYRQLETAVACACTVDEVTRLLPWLKWSRRARA